MMRSVVRWMDRRLYPSFEDNWDNTIFREVVSGRLDRKFHILDLGAGAGIVKQMNFKGFTEKVCGVDPDKRSSGNPYLDEFKVGSGDNIPYQDGTFDLVFANNVLEHLENPDIVFKEAWRVLKKGGLFLTKTPNKWHYVALIAKATPHSLHEFVNRLRGRYREDTYPTFYRVNTGASIKSCAERAGFKVREIRYIEGRPEYLRLTPFTYFFGWLYEKLVNRCSALAPFRVIVISVLEKT